MPRWFAAALVLVVTGRAHAETSDAAVAEALFQAGRELIESGSVDEACAKFAESERLDPKIGTLLNLAACHEKQQKTASAWAEYTRALAQARALKRPDHLAFAEKQLAELSPRLSTVKLVWTKPASGESVTIDGMTIGEAAVGTDLPVDPGQHVVRASAPGRLPVELDLQVAVGPAAQTLEIPELTAEQEVAPAPAPTPSAPPPSGPVAPLRPKVFHREKPPSRGPERAIGLTLIGTGVVGLIVGSYTGLRAFAKKSEAEKECHGRTCSQDGLDLYDEAGTNADISTLAFSLGLVAIGSGTFLLMSAPSAASQNAGLQLSLGRHAAALSVRSAF